MLDHEGLYALRIASRPHTQQSSHTVADQRQPALNAHFDLCPGLLGLQVRFQPQILSSGSSARSPAVLAGRVGLGVCAGSERF